MSDFVPIAPIAVTMISALGLSELLRLVIVRRSQREQASDRNVALTALLLEWTVQTESAPTDFLTEDDRAWLRAHNWQDPGRVAG